MIDFKTLGVTATVAATVLINTSAVAQSRDYISVVGSSTVYPFSTVVAERLGKTTELPTPKVEATGSGGGMKLFCSGVGTQHPDITNSSRRIKASEFKLCQSNGVNDVVEVLVGYDGIVLANSNKTDRYELTRKDIFLALAKEVPNPDGTESLIKNPYQQWKEVNPALPAVNIEVLGPPPTSGTRDAFVELAMEGGCKKFTWIKAMKKTNKANFKALCHNMREDGAFIEAGENDNLIVQKLNANPRALGIFGFSFLDQNSDLVQGSTIEGVEPDFDSIADKSYSISRPLYFYAKKAHAGVVPGIQEFITEFTRESTWGEEGYLAEKGMIPLGDDLREQVGSDARSLKILDGVSL